MKKVDKFKVKFEETNGKKNFITMEELGMGVFFKGCIEGFIYLFFFFELEGRR